MRIYNHDIDLEDDLDGGVVTDVMVLARVVRHDDDGNLEDALLVSVSQTTTYMIQAGMITFAAQTVIGDE